MKRRTFISSTWGLGAVGLGAVGLGVMKPTPLAQPAAKKRNAGSIQRLSLYTGADLAFGTTISIQVMHDERRLAERAIAEALAVAKSIDKLMTLHRDDSQLAILNRTGFLAHPHPHFLKVLREGDKLSRLTHGAFDVTVQPLWHIYRKAADRHELPTAEERRSAMTLVGWRDLVVEDSHVAFKRPGMAITLNGIAQGYAVDVARATLQAHGIGHALLDTGEFAACGRKSADRAWTVAVIDPRNAQSAIDILPMDGRCIATSGDYEMAFTPDFAHHHIFDPATGDSPVELASVTVVAPTGLQADGLSTAMMVMGMKKAIALVSSLTQVDALLVDKQGRAWRSVRLPTLIS